jgi:ribosomal peptide maturation radical SAM protein 1
MISKQTKNKVINPPFKEIPDKGEVLLLASPLVSVRTPLLGLHLLQAVCRQVGIPIHILYSNLLYATFIGPDLHAGKINLLYHLLLGERLFTRAAFGDSGLGWVVEQFLKPGWLPDNLCKIPHDMAKQVPEVVTPFREWIASVDWGQLESLTTEWTLSIARQIADSGYRVVGCSTAFGGLVPVIALLSSIKKANPDVTTIIGGPFCEGEMAKGILSLKTDIDYIFSGEGETTFPTFIKKLLAGHPPADKIICGKPLKQLDMIPPPDYQEYFDQLEAFPSSNRPSPELIRVPYETSRGCWHGKCTFCSLNGKKNFYRQKTPDRILNDLKTLIKGHRIHKIFMTDSIMPFQYFDTLLPRMSKEMPPLSIVYEIKANLTLEQVLSLKKAGVTHIAPGIESLSTSLLRRMRKGVTARENIALLRYARSAHMTISWNLLFGVPGDKKEEYEEILRLLPLICHLPPPRSMSPLAMCRFSPYQRSPGSFSISNLRPSQIYEGIYPLHADLGKLAYYLTGDFPAQSFEHPGVIISLAKKFQAWKTAWATYEIVPLEMMLPRLHITRKTNDEYVLEDTRGLPGRPEQRILDQEQASFLLVSRPWDSSADYKWALDADLGVLVDSWFIPLATAEPDLLLEFEHGCKPVY